MYDFSIIIFIVIAFYVFRLSKRLDSIEKKLDGETVVNLSERKTTQSSVENASQVVPVAQHATQSVATARKDDISDAFSMWLKEDWLIKLGGLLLLIGFGWFVSYAFLHNWIGPSGRIAIGLFLGVLVLVLGDWRIKKYTHQGEIFLILGSTIVLLTIFAARELYDFWNPMVALVVMFFSSAFVAVESIRYKRLSLALAGIIFAGVAPILSHIPNITEVGLFAYLFVTIVGILWVVAITGWRVLTFASLILIFLYSLPFVWSDNNTLLLFSFAFSAIFFITNTFALLKLEGKEMNADLITAFGNGAFLLMWILTTAPDNWQSLIIVAWMLIFVGGAFLLFRATGKREPFYIYAGVGIVMLATATAKELSGPALTIAYTIETGLIVLISYFITKKSEVAELLSFLFIGPLFLSLNSISSSAWNTSVIHDDFFVLLTLFIAFFVLTLYFFKRRLDGDNSVEKVLFTHFILGSVYFYILIWLSSHASVRNNDLATMFSLTLYTIFGLVFYIYGRLRDIVALRKYGGILLALVVGRLILVETGAMELTQRIITFFLVGILLISTAFIGRKKKVNVPQEGN